MSTLIIDRRDAALDSETGRLTVRLGGAEVAHFPLAQIERLVVRGQATLSTRLLAALHEGGAGILLLSGRRNEATATLLGKPHSDGAIRTGQLVLSLDSAARLRLARWVVAAKIAAQARALARGEAARADRRALLYARRTLPGFIARAREASDIASLSGIEGAAAAAYFPALGDLFPAGARFCGRNRRPPRDPGNAVLSLGYTLITFDAAREAALAGLDPLVGFLHALSPGRPSLACDLVEPVRPRIDLWAVGLFRSDTLRSDHFHMDGEACLLGKAGRSAFLAAWEEEAGLFRRMLREMCRVLARRGRNAAKAADTGEAGTNADPLS